jgi:transcriptional regulator with XRE-family HTH domain
VETGRLLLAARLRARRTRAGLQLAELADRAGMSQALLSDLERGRRLPTLPTLDSLARALDTTAVNLLRDLYPWGTTEPPSEAPLPPLDGRAGRRIPGRTRRPAP